VLFGGTSAEREISLISGQAVLSALQEAGVNAQAFDPAETPILQTLKPMTVPLLCCMVEVVKMALCKAH
jgi:D-alanine-D-alanine ligase-like ATP-grasp enzyme